jgi:hypothetical protein
MDASPSWVSCVTVSAHNGAAMRKQTKARTHGVPCTTSGAARGRLMLTVMPSSHAAVVDPDTFSRIAGAIRRVMMR